MKTNPFERSGSTLSFKNIWYFDKYTVALGLEASGLDEGALSNITNRRMRVVNREHLVNYRRTPTFALK